MNNLTHSRVKDPTGMLKEGEICFTPKDMVDQALGFPIDTIVGDVVVRLSLYRGEVLITSRLVDIQPVFQRICGK